MTKDPSFVTIKSNKGGSKLKEFETKQLLDFIDKTPTAYHCVKNLKEELIENGYQELREGDSWYDLKKDQGKHFVTRGDSSLIAFQIPDRVIGPYGYQIVATHTDSPTFRVKQNGEHYQAIIEGSGYNKLDVEGYGSGINYTFLDRPLSIAGRVLYEVMPIEQIYSEVVNLDKDMLVIPSQAIHVNREVNEGAKFNRQIDMQPIMTLNHNINWLDTLVVEDALRRSGKPYPKDSVKLLDHDLFLYNRDKARIIGADDEIIMAPRLDDLACLYPSYRAFLDSSFENDTRINVFCAFHNEEIGSLTKQGADSSFLADVLVRVAKSLDMDIHAMLGNSFMISADNAHAAHPNALGKTDDSNKVLMNKGIVVKHHTNYTTDAFSGGIMKKICERANVPYQDFTCRSDMICGATLGGISNSHVSIDSVDIGLAQLAMHSANEVMGAADPDNLYWAMYEYYHSAIDKYGNEVRIMSTTPLEKRKVMTRKGNFKK